MPKGRIYIVEDDESLGNIYTTSLEKAGYTTYLNQDGKNICREIEERDVDLIVLDMHTPYAWGPDIVACLQKTKKRSDIRILVTTADIIVGQRMQGSVDRVLIKPVYISLLLKTVEEILAE